MRIGSLCSGYGGIDLAVENYFGATTAWHCEWEDAPSKILAHHWNIPNHRDLTAVDWDTVEPVDILTGGYPCFTEDALVLTRDGYRSIAEVRVGDMVLTHRKRWRRVTALMSKQADSTVVVSAQGTPAVRCTLDHPWWTQEGEWVAAENLRGRRVVQAVPTPEKPSLTPELLWVLGRHLADGYIQSRADRSTGGRVTITCAHEETEEVLAGLHAAGLHGYVHRERTATKVAVTRNELYELALMCGRGAALKHVPGWLIAQLDAPRAEALLSGYLSGDGYRDNKANAWTATSISKALVHSMALVAQVARNVVCSIRLNPVPPTTVIEGRTVNQRPFWKLTVPDRNRSGRIEDGYAYKLCRKVEPADAAAVYNIAVDEDESYVVDNAVVHNCQPFSAAGQRKGADDERHLWPHVREAIRHLRPRIALLENVAGHRSLGFDRVLGDCAEDGLSVRWVSLRASDIGAPHGRERLFFVVTDPADQRYERRGSARVGWDGSADRGDSAADAHDGAGDGQRSRTQLGKGSAATSNPCSVQPERWLGNRDVAGSSSSRKGAAGKRERHGDAAVDSGATATDTASVRRREGWTQPARVFGRSDAAIGGDTDWNEGRVDDINPKNRPREDVRDVRTGVHAATVQRSAGGSHEVPESEALQPELRQHEGGRTGQLSSVACPQGDDPNHVCGLWCDERLAGASPRPEPRQQRPEQLGVSVPELPHEAALDGGLGWISAIHNTSVNWGAYEPAIRRWETTIGRAAPDPTEPGRNGPRLSPAFVEFMMGLPAGWVTSPEIGLTRNEQLKALGNGVVPQQALEALRRLCPQEVAT